MITVIGIDPSVTCTGVVVVTIAAGQIKIVGAENIRPARSCTTTTERIDSVMRDLDGLVADHLPEVAVVEMTSNHVFTRHKGAGAGLAGYGRIVGRVEEYMLRECCKVVRPGVDELWRGRTKASRHAGLRVAYPELRKASHDILDAFHLILWAHERKMI